MTIDSTAFRNLTLQFCEANRAKTLHTLDRLLEIGGENALAWRPGEGRAHCGWQLMHIGVTEVGFASARLHGRDNPMPDLYSAYGHGSTPTDTSPPADEIRAFLGESRAMLVKAVRELDGVDLDAKPDSMADRGWSYADALHLLNWHECHHQGQAHITANLLAASK